MNTFDQMPTLEIRSCRTCGGEVTANFRYCRYCGASQMAEPTSNLSMDDKPISETDVDRDTGTSIEKIRVIMANDHLVVRQGLPAFLATQPEFKIVVEASSGEEAVALCQECAPDVASMDLMMPGIGAGEAVRQIKPVSPRTQIIILTSPPVVAISRPDHREHVTLKRPS